MNEEKAKIARKALDLSDQEWEAIGEPAREAILRLVDSAKSDPDDSKNLELKEKRHQLAEGVKAVLALHDDQFNALPEWQRETLLRKINQFAKPGLTF